MDDNTTYYKDPPKLLYELMQDTLGDEYTYFLGSPTMLGKDAYPCVVVQTLKANNTAQDAPTGHDNVSEQIAIFVMILENSAAASQVNEDTIQRKLYNVIQGRDPATGFYMTGTVLNALRKNITLGGAILDQDLDIDYDIDRRAENDVMVGSVTLTLSERVQVPERF